MTTQALFHDLISRGTNLSTNNGRLDIDAPDGLLTDELLSTIRERKAELLELLTLDTSENIEMHNSTLFDVVIAFYDGTRLVIPQERIPEGWQPPF